MHIRDGLVDAKHCAAMGDSIWLYLYLHKVCAQKTGRIKHYQHADAATALGISVSTVKRQLPVLVAGDYITVTRGYNHLAIQITRYEWQEGRAAYRSDQPTEVSEPDLHEDSEVAELTLLCSTEIADMPRLSDAIEPLAEERSVNSAIEKCQNGHARSIYTSINNRDVIIAEPELPVMSSCADAPGPLFEKKPRALRVTGADLLVEEMRTALGVAEGSEAAGKRWAAIFREKLSGCTAEERSRFLRWFLSDGYWTKSMLYQLSDRALRAQCDAWLMAGKTERKEVPPTASKSRPPSWPVIPTGTPDLPPWIEEDLRFDDHEADRVRDKFVTHWGKHPAFMTPDELRTAGIPDYVRPPR